MKPTRKSIAEKLNEWSMLNAKLSKLKQAQLKDLQPLKEEYDARCTPIIEKHQSKISPVMAEMNAIEDEISKALLSVVDDEGVPKMRLVEGDTASAAVSINSVRECDAKVFFDSVSQSAKDKKFWDCFKVQIGKAEKFLGDKLNEISKLKQTFKVTITGK